MGIKTVQHETRCYQESTLKNLPTTWGLRPTKWTNATLLVSLKNLPTTWGLRQ